LLLFACSWLQPEIRLALISGSAADPAHIEVYLQWLDGAGSRSGGGFVPGRKKRNHYQEKITRLGNGRIGCVPGTYPNKRHRSGDHGRGAVSAELVS
jgi:hypothetical protein